MKNPRNFLIVLVIFCFSCSGESSHLVTRDELRLAAKPNIIQLELIDTTVVTFNDMLGSFDTDKKVVEGVTRSGKRDTIPLSQIQSAVLTGGEKISGGETAFTLLAVLAAAFVVGIVIFYLLLSSFFYSHH